MVGEPAAPDPAAVSARTGGQLHADIPAAVTRPPAARAPAAQPPPSPPVPAPAPAVHASLRLHHRPSSSLPSADQRFRRRRCETRGLHAPRYRRVRRRRISPQPSRTAHNLLNSRWPVTVRPAAACSASPSATSAKARSEQTAHRWPTAVAVTGPDECRQSAFPARLPVPDKPRPHQAAAGFPLQAGRRPTWTTPRWSRDDLPPTKNPNAWPPAVIAPHRL